MRERPRLEFQRSAAGAADLPAALPADIVARGSSGRGYTRAVVLIRAPDLALELLASAEDRARGYDHGALGIQDRDEPGRAMSASAADRSTLAARAGMPVMGSRSRSPTVWTA